MTGSAPAVALVAGAINVPLTGTAATTRGDRMILRSTREGRPDVYAVFERASGDAWRRVTGDLTAAQLDHWPSYCGPRTISGDCAFERWLEQVASRPRTTGPADVHG